MQFPMVMAILSGVMYAVAALGYKMAERLNCRTSTFIVVFSIAGGAFAIIKSFSETSEWNNPRLWLLGIAMGVLFDLAIFFILQSNKNGPASISWTMLQLSLLIPVILSPLLFQERIYWIDPIILATFVLMLAFFAQSLRKTDDSDQKKTRRYLLYLLGIFFSNGFFLLGNKLKYEFFEDNNTAALTFIVFLVGGLIALMASNRRSEKWKIHGAEWKAGALTGLSNSIGTIFYLGAMSLPAPVVFPLSSSIALLGGVILTTRVYGEKFDIYKIIAIALGLAALLLAIFREPIVFNVSFL
jgi:drug/metabolite transporter (DMT)-like permease